MIVSETKDGEYFEHHGIVYRRIGSQKNYCEAIAVAKRIRAGLYLKLTNR